MPSFAGSKRHVKYTYNSTVQSLLKHIFKCKITTKQLLKPPDAMVWL